jgi:translation initiation factor eIF-2B subunit delta
MPSTDKPVDAAPAGKPANPPAAKPAKSNGAPAAAPADGEKKLTALELKAQKKAEKAAKRAQVIQARGGAPGVPAAPAPSNASKGSANASKKGEQRPAHKRTPSSTQNLPIRQGGHGGQRAVESAPAEPKKEDKTVELFRHLYKTRAKTIAGAGNVHPAVLALGQQMRTYVVCGSNARLVATLQAFKRVCLVHAHYWRHMLTIYKVIESYTTPPGTSLGRHFTAHVLSPQIEYLTACRPMSISMGTAIRWLKLKIAKVDPDQPDSEAKEELCDDIDEYVRDRITLADTVIANTASRQVIKDGDVILTFAKSSIVQQALAQAHTDGRRFRVIVVDSRPLFEGRAMAKALISLGIDVKYCLMNGVSHCMASVTKVILGAHAMMSNGVLYSRIGTSQVAMEAKDLDVPVIVLCESVKCTERVALDSIVFNEVADPDELLLPGAGTPQGLLTGWRETKNLQLLNLMHDATPAEYLSMIVTELGIVPPSSVPVLQRLANEAQ